MLGAFLFFFRRSRQAMRAKQGALATSEVAHEALVERQQELSQALGRLEESRQERERLLERTVEIAEHERINLAGDLHDGPIQQLTVVALMLDQLTGRIGRGELDQTQAAIAQIRENVSGQMTSLRVMMVELRPPMLDEGGISAGLHDLAESVLSDTRLTWDVRSTIGNARFAPEIETVAYRVAREALVNIRKHAEATDVDVILEHDRDTLHLVIADNGKGFTRPEGTRTGEHSGLLGIEERLASIGGTCALHTAPGTGTRWEASLPWKLQPAHGRLDGHSLVAV
jgi:signal transduction histidine kinase